MHIKSNKIESVFTYTNERYINVRVKGMGCAWKMDVGILAEILRKSGLRFVVEQKRVHKHIVPA